MRQVDRDMPETPAAAGTPTGDDRPAAAHVARGGGVSLRLRLMLMLLAVFGIIQISMSVLGLLYVRRTADMVFNERLTARTDAIARRLQAAAAGSNGVSDAALTALALENNNGVFVERAYVSVYGGDGQVLATSCQPALPNIPPTPGAPGERVRHVSFTGDPDHPGEAISVRAASAAIGDGAGQPMNVVVGTTDAFARHTSEQFSRHILVATPIGLLAAAIAGWLIAGIAVRPLQRLSQIASGLRPDTLQDPIDIGSTAVELTKLQSDLDSMRRRLETGYEAQERFVANVSHEIKTPIATVLTEAQTLPRKAQLPADVRQFLDSTQDEMRRLGRLVESFLILTRVRHGKKVESTGRRVDVNDLVMESVLHCNKMAQQHGLQLSPELAVEADDQVLAINGDPELLRTMVDNLVRNAIRFSPRGTMIELTVQPERGQVSICVLDRGPGIAPELIDKIFDRFSQAKSEEKLGRGSGLGLEIAQGIAELHGGKITVSNRDNGGCTFCATLPLAAGTGTPNATQPAKAAPALARGPSRTITH